MALRAAMTVCMACALSVAVSACGGGADPAEPTEPAETVEPAETRPACDAPCYGEARSAGAVPGDVAVAVSGIAASARTPGAYYVVSDEAGTSQVAVVDEGGSPLGRMEVEGMDAANAEALAVGPCGDATDESCLYVGDIGDHVGRPEVIIYRVREPEFAAEPADSADHVAAEALRYTYADSPTDAEALIVDDEGRPLIVSKGEEARLYRGPANGGVLEAVAEINLPEPTNGVFAGLVGNVVTGASMASGAPRRVLLRTYDEVLEFRADDHEADPAEFPGWPWRRVPSGSLIQAEAITYRIGECGYLTVSELTGDIAAVPC